MMGAKGSRHAVSATMCWCLAGLLPITLLVAAPRDVAAEEDWVAARIRNAKRGQREIVRIPLAQKSLGWGCDCPEQYMGMGTDTADGPWLAVSAEKHVSFPEAGRMGYIVVVEGYFTGKHEIYKSSDGEPGEEETYRLLGFHVLRSRPWRTKDEDLEPTVVLAGDEAKRVLPLLTDERPWLVLAASIPLGDSRGAKRAQKLRDRLVKRGFAQTEILDSRQISGLGCCFRVVVLARLPTREAAQEVLEKARTKRIRAQIRRGW